MSLCAGIPQQYRGRLLLEGEQIAQAYLDSNLFGNIGDPLQLKKCCFFTKNIGNLCYEIQPRKLESYFHITDGIKKLESPTNITKLGWFFGTCIVFQQFLSKFSHIALSLNRKLKKYQPKDFDALSAEDSGTIKKLQDGLISRPVLVLPHPDCHFTPNTGASIVRGRCVLQQE